MEMQLRLAALESTLRKGELRLQNKQEQQTANNAQVLLESHAQHVELEDGEIMNCLSDLEQQLG